MLNKIQSLFLICALPVLLCPFGPEVPPPQSFWSEPRRAWPATAIWMAIALIMTYLARDLFVTGFSSLGTGLPLLPLRFGAGAYWPAFACWIAIGMAAYARFWRITVAETLAAMFATVAGCMIGLLALYIRYHPNDVVVVFHQLEGMIQFAVLSDPQLSTGGMLRTHHIQYLLQAVAGVIARRTFVLASAPRPTIFLEWFVIAATVVAIRRCEWRLVLQVAALMLTDWGIDMLGMARGLKQEYFLLTDPLAIIAAVLLIAKLTGLQRHRWTYPVGAGLIVAHILVSHAEPVKHIFRTDGPEVICGLYGNAKRIERFSYCKSE
jgi:hypothetical protein